LIRKRIGGRSTTSEDDHGFRGVGMVKFKIEEVTDGLAK